MPLRKLGEEQQALWVGTTLKSAPTLNAGLPVSVARALLALPLPALPRDADALTVHRVPYDSQFLILTIALCRYGFAGSS